MSPTLYVVTAHQFNHVDRPMPIDDRFFHRPLNSVFYFVDRDGVPDGFDAQALSEIDLNPAIHDVGRTHLAEWTFLLTEYEKRFASYPFYVVSSRFHEKNHRLPTGLAYHWDEAIGGLDRYGWGYLPSYDRDTGFEDLRAYWDKGFLAMTTQGIDLIERQYGVRYVSEYRFMSDFFCNYIGFKTRAHFEQYVEFYLPLLRLFFDKEYRTIEDGNAYCKNRGIYRNEKPLTFLLEMISHLFFYKNRLPFFGLSYGGSYQVDEWSSTMTKLSRFDLSPKWRPFTAAANVLRRRRLITPATAS